MRSARIVAIASLVLLVAPAARGQGLRRFAIVAGNDVGGGDTRNTVPTTGGSVASVAAVSTNTIQPSTHVPVHEAPSELGQTVIRLARRIASLRAMLSALTSSLASAAAWLLREVLKNDGTATAIKMPATVTVVMSSSSVNPRCARTLAVPPAARLSACTFEIFDITSPVPDVSGKLRALRGCDFESHHTSPEL